MTDSFESKLEEIMELYATHSTDPPFTIQRIAEILVQGDQEYKRTHCLMNAIVKLLSVQASVNYYDDPFPPSTPSSYPFSV
ncbi:hypothetical protein EON65_55190 [archaeon]|nr:MAG: hypothetical protein EON65_55190 [archaeon]